MNLLPLGRSLRARLAIWYSVMGAALIGAYVLSIYSFVDSRMAQPLDHRLRQDLAVVLENLQAGTPDGWTWEGEKLGTQRSWSHPWFELWNEKRELVVRMWPLEEDRLEQLPYAPPVGVESLSVFNVSPDLRLRVLSVPLPETLGSSAWTLRILRPHEALRDPLGDLRLIMIVALPLIVFLLVVGGYLLTRHWLRPLDAMVQAAERISARNLKQRIHIGSAPGELDRLAQAFNRTLDRLEDSFSTLDRFVSDASHELRTPLTTLRSVGEVALLTSRSPADYRDVIGSMLEETQRLEGLIERLLELASIEGNGRTRPPERVRLDEIALACAAELGILAEARQQHLKVEAQECEVAADPVLLRQALQNLIDNAIKFSPDASTIWIRVVVHDRTVQLHVDDEGPGIDPNMVPRIADRFFRATESRSRKTGGYGLGLAITKAYALAMGATLTYEARFPKGSRFSLTFGKAVEGPAS